MKDFSGRVAVVTGGASGIGFATCEKLVAEGMKLVLSDVEAGALEKARATLAERGADVLAVRTDVTKPEEMDALAERAWSHFGGAHVVVNNAGVVVSGALWENSLDDLHWTVDVNLWGVVHGVRSFVPRLIEQNEPAHVVNIASMAAVTTAPYLDIYTVTKHGVLALSESLHKELLMLQSPVKASVVCPGLIRTNLMTADRNRPEARAERADLSPGGKMIDELLRSGVEGEGGWPPSRVADEILAGLREDRFYIFPAQPELLAGLDARLESLRLRKNPELGLPG
jgi:NAD(P)-dependent dehydrogenase (short-subunit alcohol dehydrogenase family)